MKVMDPPTRTRGFGRAIAHLKESMKLRGDPGTWYLVWQFGDNSRAASFAYQVRTGALVAFRPSGAFEATARGGNVHARYLGETS